MDKLPMDPVRNPFAPGAGTPPPELAGRADLIATADIALQRVAMGRPEKSIILVGLRGVGKTVLLNRLDQTARSLAFETANIEAHESKSLPELLVPHLRGILQTLSWLEAGKDKVRRALGTLKAFGLKVKYGDLELGVDPVPGVADSGDLEVDIPALLIAVAEAAQATGRPVALLIDELQYLAAPEFSAIIMAIHKVNQRSLPLILIGAGLPQIHGLAGSFKSYAERLFRFPDIGALSPQDARLALVNPAEQEGVCFEEAAVQAILQRTQRYPYFLQQWAYEAWNLSENDSINDAIIDQASEAAVAELDTSFFKVRFDRCTPAERRYMRALAHFGEGHHRSGDIADLMQVKVTSVAPVRSSLIKKGMVYSPAHGSTAFTVPLFDDYMRRVMSLE